MSSPRTQVYFRGEQRRRIDALAQVRGVTMAEVVRLAVDRYLDAEVPTPGEALAATFGALPDADAPDRDEWDRG